ncbi:GNAT family N-acetyltransferase [Myroides sp. LJL110]
MDPIIWHTKSFQELTNSELYDILKLRSEVFVVEQNCVYLDIDNKDKACLHVFATCLNQVVATSRIVPCNLSYPQVSIGRVAVHKDFRALKLGRELMQYSMDQVQSNFGPCDIQIGAQVYLDKFYKSFGFQCVSEPYDEDGILHVDMLFEVNNKN